MIEAPRCTDCGCPMEWRTVDQEYERQGVRVRLTGLPAMVCPRCGAIAFDPDTTDHILAAANALFRIAGDRHKGVLAAACA
ncbi:MAG: YgiT-type zinc finger protein [Armatimonadetes bacterium]|nr:YgiT-type zinc finger protein [Armatimonadota bacterium]